MKIADSFWSDLRRSSASALLLDYDGTLAPFNSNRDAAFPYPEITGMLDRIMECGTRVVIVSGRRARDIPQLLRLRVQPEVWGCHGYERIAGDNYQVLKPDEDLLRALAAVDEQLECEGLGSRIEYKAGAVAVHLRDASPGAEDEIRAVVSRVWRASGSRRGLRLCKFEQGLEFRLPNVDKGAVVRALLAEVPDSCVMAYLGDDQTDEDAFAALDGKGMTILVRDQHRPTRAQAWLRPPNELRDFLCSWVGCVQGGAKWRTTA